MTSRALGRGDPRRAVKLTRRRYLLIKAMAAGGGPFVAVEAVASTALEHPEWDMDEMRTWNEWETGS